MPQPANTPPRADPRPPAVFIASRTAWGCNSSPAVGPDRDPEDIGAMVAFLASDLAKQITGSDFRVDGGQIATI